MLEYEDIFDGSHVVEAKVREMVEAAKREIADIEARGGVIEAVESGYLKQRLVESNAARLRAIESGEQIVVGVNKYVETAPSPLTENLDDAILTVDPQGRACGDRGDQSLARQARRKARQRCAHQAAGRRAQGRQHHAALDRGGEGGRHHRRVGTARCAR